MEITAEEENKEKLMKIIEDSRRNLQDNNNNNNNNKKKNTQITGVPEEKNKIYKKIFEEIIVKNFPNMGKEIATLVQESKRVQ